MPIAGATGDCWEVRVRGSMENQETDNVLHFVEETSTTDVELHLILALAECFITHLLPVTSSAWSLRDLVWKKVSPTLGPEQITVPAGDLTADGNAAALPSFNSVVISKRTLEGGRSKRGRMFLPGIPEAATTNSQLDTGHAFWAAVIAFAACLAEKFINIGEPLGSDQFALAVYSRTLGGATLPFGAAGFTKVSSLNVSQLIGSTRSRKVGRGA